jgi:hypothetical protein
MYQRHAFSFLKVLPPRNFRRKSEKLHAFYMVLTPEFINNN